MSRFFRKYSYYLSSIFKLFLGFKDPILIGRIFLFPGKSEVKTVRLRKQKLEFRVRGAMDVWSIKETFLDRFYERCGFRIQPGWKVIDIGAGLGDFTIFAATDRPDTQIFAFEPFPESFALAQENLQINNVANVQVFDGAVAAASGSLILDLAGNEPLQIRSQLEAAEDPQHLAVRAFSLADAFGMLGIDSCNLLKLDCEGAEYPILFNSSQDTLERIDHIVMEYHDDVLEYTHHDLARFLDERGFRVETFSNPVHSHLGYLRAVREK